MRTRIDPRVRKKQILTSAYLLAEKIGYQCITNNLLTEEMGISRSLILHYFRSLHQLKINVLKEAIRKENLAIIAQAIALKDPLVKELSPDLKEKIIKHITQ